MYNILDTFMLSGIAICTAQMGKKISCEIPRGIYMSATTYITDIQNVCI